MNAALQMLPILGFMLIPLFIPLVAVAFGAVVDIVKAPARLAAQPSAKGTHAAPATRRAPATASVG